MSLFKQNQAVNELSLDLPQKSPPQSPTTLSTAELISVGNDVVMKNVGDAAPILVAANGTNDFITASKLEEIGIITVAIEGPVTASGRDGTTRTLNNGDSVYLHDTIATTAQSYVKITLNDGTVFQLGPNSRARMDKYAYEPEDEFLDEFEAYVDSGSFRYVSGKISGDNQGQHTVIKTPSAHIGIRGSEIDARVDDDGSTTVLHLSGLVTITSLHYFKEVMVYERGTSVYIPNEKASHSLELLTEEHIELRNQHWQVFDRVLSIEENQPSGEQNTSSIQSTSQNADHQKTSDSGEDVGAHNPFSPAQKEVDEDESVDDILSEHEAFENRQAIKNQADYELHEESNIEAEQDEPYETKNNRPDSEKEYVADDSNGVLDNDTLPPDYGLPTDGDTSLTDKDEDGASTDEDSTSTDEDGASTDEDSSSTDEDGASTDEDGASTDEDGDSIDDDSTSTDDDSTSTDEDGASTDEDGASTDEDSSSTDEDTDDKVLELTLHEDQSHIIHLSPEEGEITQLIQPTQGEVVDNLDGSLTYTPVDHFNGEDSFSYILNGTIPVVVNFTILPVNDSPVAQDDIASIQEDSELLLPAEMLLKNDEDVDEGDKLSLVSVQENEFTQGTAFQNDDGDLVYLPNPHFFGQAVVTYTLQDSEGVRDTAQLTIHVAPVNDAPIAASDFVPFNHGEVLTLSTASLLANDQDVENDTLNVIKVFDPKGGTVNLNDEQISFIPNPDFTQGGFNYSVSDGNDISTGQVIINRQTVAPVAQNDGPFDMANQHRIIIPEADLLKNDHDPDGSPLRVIEITNSWNGQTQLDANGDVVFTKGPTFEEQGGFEYQISDGQGGFDTARVTVIDKDINQLPVAQEDGPFDLGNRDSIIIKAADLLNNDRDPDGSPLRVIEITNSVNGDAKLDDHGDVVFTRGPGFEGQGEFEYKISDEQGGFDTARVTVIGDAPNQPPIAQEDGPFDLGNRDSIIIKAADLLNNDRDPDGSPLRVIEITNSVNGDAKLDANGDVVFTRGPGFEDQGGFEYQISDGQGGFDTARVTVIGDGPNQPPIAQEDGPFDLVNRDSIIIKAADLLNNDRDPEGSPLRVIEITNSVNGDAKLDEHGDVVFTRGPGFEGQGGFEYQISDNQGGFDTARVTVIGNLPPIAHDDGPQNVPKTQFVVLSFESLLANDTDPNPGDTFTLVEVKNPINGDVKIVGTNNIIFTPAFDLTGNASFEYVITDNHGASSTGIYQMNLINTPPNARSDNLTTLADTPLPISADLLLSNDFDADGDPLFVISVNAPDKGTLNPVESDWLFTPDIGFKGDIQFEYTIKDTSNGQASATVTVTVTASPLIARDDPSPDQPSIITPKNTATLILGANLLSNDDGSALTITAVDNVNNARVELDVKGDIILTPNLDFTGNATFDYTLTDADGNTDQATVTVIVENRPPVANEDSATTLENVVLTIPVADLLANDSDPDLDEVTITAVNNASNGSVELNDKGTVELEDDEVVFTPALDFIGEAGFEYTIADTSAGTATSTVAVTVRPNLPPIITLPNGSTPLVYNTLGKQPQAIDPNATITDDDSPDFDGGRLEVVITKNRIANDTLEIQNLGQISVSSNTGGIISFNSTPIGNFFINLISGALVANLNTAATPENTTALLQAITYKNTSPTPSTESRTIEMSLTDGDGGTSNIVSREIEVIMTNVPPVATDETISRPFNSYTTIPLSDLLANDSDANPSDILSISELSNLSEGVEAKIQGNEIQLFIDALISANFEEARFDYTLNDGKGSKDIGTVFIKPSNVIPGTAGDDNLEGTDNLDIILGKGGNDTFEPSVGPDILLGGEDDDLFLFDPNTATGTHINGSNGIDTLSLSTENEILDFLQNRTLPKEQQFHLQGIEKIDLNTHSDGNNQIRLSIDDVLEISDTNRLMIEGDGSSLVNSTGQGWRNEGIDSTGLYNRYTSGEAELLISVDIASQFIS